MKTERGLAQHFAPRRMAVTILGTLIYCIGVNIFTVPAGLYSGGLLGPCQLIRTLFTEYLGISFGTMDISGILYYAINIPILAMAWIRLDRWFVIRTIINVTCMSLFLSFIPTVPVLGDDILASCIVGGVLSGIGVGLLLRGSATLGGMDMWSMMIIQKHPHFSVGTLGLIVNLMVYGACAMMFDISVAIYSIVYAALYSIVLDRVHSQNIDVEVTVITKKPVEAMEQAVFQELHRGVTQLRGTGAYTSDDVNILYIALSQYEVNLLRHVIREHDPNAFFIVKDHVKIYGNYEKRL